MRPPFFFARKSFRLAADLASMAFATSAVNECLQGNALIDRVLSGSRQHGHFECKPTPDPACEMPVLPF